MANAEVEVKVCVERCIHDGLKKALTEIRDKHGVIVTDVRVNWIDVSAPNGYNAIIREIQITTKTGD